jgi:ankyrin repeat protein
VSNAYIIMAVVALLLIRPLRTVLSKQQTPLARLLGLMRLLVLLFFLVPLGSMMISLRGALSTEASFDGFKQVLASKDSSKELEYLKSHPEVSTFGGGSELLSLGITNDSLEVVRYALGHGADVEGAFQGWTPLLSAVSSKGVDDAIPLLLLASKANPNATIEQGGNSVLMQAAGFGKEAIVKELLVRHADVQYKSRDGSTALHRAAAGGYDAVCRLLMQAGAHPTQVNGKGQSAVDLARKFNHPSTVALLSAGR